MGPGSEVSRPKSIEWDLCSRSGDFGPR
ncbi:hypothetical protein AMTRI_Chr11g95750 [Amborella trichopoda]